MKLKDDWVFGLMILRRKFFIINIKFSYKFRWRQPNSKACNLDENELDAVIKQIKFLYNNGRIKKASTVKKLSKSAWGWFKRKVL